MRKRVLFDVDGVLANFCGSAAAVMSRVSGRTISHDDIRHWDVTKLLDDESHVKESKRLIESAGFCASIEPYPGSREAVREVAKVADVFFVTAPMHSNRHWIPERIEWLESNFGADPKDIVFTYRKFLVKGSLIVEDSGPNAESWLTHHPDGSAVLWDRPYNSSEGGRAEARQDLGRGP